MKKNKKEIYCKLEYFMTHKCDSCKQGRKCEEWYENRNKRNRNNKSNDSANRRSDS